MSCRLKKSNCFVWCRLPEHDMYTGYELTVLGVHFTLVVGVQAGASEWNLCCVNSKQRVTFLEDCSELSRHHYHDLRREARAREICQGRSYRPGLCEYYFV